MAQYERLDASDPVDQASALELMQLSIALQNQRNTRNVLHAKLAEVTNKKDGSINIACLCHYCDAILQYVDSQDSQDTEKSAGFPRFCDEDCRDDWEKEKRMLALAGKSRA